MASLTQIVPEHAFPYTQTYIYDNTAVLDQEFADAEYDPALGYIFAFGADKGIDNRFVLKRTQKAWVNTFGVPNFKKYGQPALMPYHVLENGSTKVWCMRVLPDNATRAHALVSMFYKIDTTGDASKRKFRIKYTSKSFDPKTTPIISKEDLYKLRNTADGSLSDKGVYVDGEGYTQVPGIIAFAANGRGKGGNTSAIRVAMSTTAEREWGIKLFGFEVLSTDNGLIKEAEFRGSLATSVKYDSATSINDILEDIDEGIPMVDINVDEDRLEAVYDAYIAFTKEQHTALQKELETKMTNNSVTYGMLHGSETVPEDKIALVTELREIEDMIEATLDENLPAFDEWDPIFGYQVASGTNMLPFIKFPELLTDDVDTSADDYVAADYTQTPIIDLAAVRGITLSGGTDGYLDTPRVEKYTNAEGKVETTQWTFEDEMEDLYNRAWSGDLDKRIITPKRIKFNAMFDANYPYSVKCTMAKLCAVRNDSIFYMDTGIVDTLSTNALANLIKMYGVFANRLISKNIHHYTVKDPITKKRIKVTITYFLATKFWEHNINNGTYIPFVKGNCQLTGHIKNSLEPSIEEYDSNVKDLLVENRFNYFETVEENVFQRATQNTAQELDSDLLEESNVHTLYTIKREIEKDVNAGLYNFNESEVRNNFTELENEKFKSYNGKEVQSVYIYFAASKWEKEHSIIHCYVTVVFRAIFKRATVEIDINRRNYSDDQ